MEMEMYQASDVNGKTVQQAETKTASFNNNEHRENSFINTGCPQKSKALCHT